MRCLITLINQLVYLTVTILIIRKKRLNGDIYQYVPLIELISTISVLQAIAEAGVLAKQADKVG